MTTSRQPRSKIPVDLLATAQWQDEVDGIAAQHRVPGAQVGLLSLDEDGLADVRLISTGVTSLSTQVEVTHDALFQYGSITKVWTATLVMQLVDEGLLTLDTPVAEVLSDFQLARPDWTRKVTIQHLLTHTSGIDGDLFIDTGDGDDCLEKYIPLLREATSITPPGGPLSYCNSGYVVAGRVIEAVRGQVWDEALRTGISGPLGLEHVITRAKDAPLYRTAVGHLTGPDGGAYPTKTWMIPRSMGPAGIVTGSARDLLTFAAAHLRDGTGYDGARILSGESAQMMRREHVSLAEVSSIETGWGLGWYLDDWNSEPSATHSGGTIGQTSDLHVFAESGVAVAVLTNSDGGRAFIREIESLIGTELGLVRPEVRITPDKGSVDLHKISGTYRNGMTSYTLSVGSDSQGRLTVTQENLLLEPQPPTSTVVTPIGGTRLLANLDGENVEIAYVEDHDHSYLYAGLLLERVEITADADGRGGSLS